MRAGTVPPGLELGRPFGPGFISKPPGYDGDSAGQCAADIMKSILMRSCASLFFVGWLVMLSAVGFGQSVDPDSLPSAPSASAQRNAPAKQPAPSETKPAPAPDSKSAGGQNS